MSERPPQFEPEFQPQEQVNPLENSEKKPELNSGKELEWQKIVEDIEGTTDGLGKKIEKGIKDTIIGLNAHEINTYQSCHGHVNRGRISPWVAIEAPNAPEPRFLPQQEVTREVYEQYGISENLWKKQEEVTEEFKQEEAKLQKLEDSEYRKAVDELRAELFKKYGFLEDDVEKFNKLNKDHELKETPEYEKWSEENKKLHTRVGQLLEEFYQDRVVPENVKILLTEHYQGNHFGIYSGKEDYDKEPKKKISEKEKRELTERLKLYRAEFKEFAEFLKGKFFGGIGKNPEEAKQELHISPEEKEQKLKHDLFGVQLQYAQRLFEGKIPSPSDNINTESMDFKQTLEEFTDLSTIVRDAFLKRTGKDFGSEENYKEFEKINQTVTEKVVDAYNNNPDTWMNGLDVFISDAINQLPEGVPLQEARETQPEESHAGILRYSVGAGHGGLEDYGITPKDECIKTHLDPLFKQEDVPKGKKLSELYRDAYAIIAKEVKESHPNAKALVSESWLFDTNLAKEIGMHIYPSGNENMFRARTFWGQFITREGKINEERVKQFLETGKPPFRVKSGYIPIEEFMSEYGSKQK